MDAVGTEVLDLGAIVRLVVDLRFLEGYNVVNEMDQNNLVVCVQGVVLVQMDSDPVVLVALVAEKPDEQVHHLYRSHLDHLLPPELRSDLRKIDDVVLSAFRHVALKARLLEGEVQGGSLVPVRLVPVSAQVGQAEKRQEKNHLSSLLDGERTSH